MKRLQLALASFALAAGLVWTAAGAWAATSVSVNLQIGDPYRGPSIVFRHEPDVILVPETRVYYVRNCDYDLYRYGSYWYYCHDDGWYRARGPRGPFRYISHRTVPRAVYTVPVKYRRHWREFPGRGHAYGHSKQDHRQASREAVERERPEGKHKHK